MHEERNLTNDYSHSVLCFDIERISSKKRHSFIQTFELFLEQKFRNLKDMFIEILKHSIQ